MTLSKAIGKLEVKSEITIVAKCIDPSVKLRPCLPIQCSVENKRIEGMVIMIPTGASLHQARQLIIDYAFSFQSTTIEVYNQGNILEVKTALKELLVCGEWEYIHNGDKIDEEDEKTTSAIEYGHLRAKVCIRRRSLRRRIDSRLVVGGTVPTLSTAANAVDRIDYVIKASNEITEESLLTSGLVNLTLIHI